MGQEDHKKGVERGDRLSEEGTLGWMEGMVDKRGRHDTLQGFCSKFSVLQKYKHKVCEISLWIESF